MCAVKIATEICHGALDVQMMVEVKVDCMHWSVFADLRFPLPIERMQQKLSSLNAPA